MSFSFADNMQNTETVYWDAQAGSGHAFAMVLHVQTHPERMKPDGNAVDKWLFVGIRADSGLVDTAVISSVSEGKWQENAKPSQIPSDAPAAVGRAVGLLDSLPSVGRFTSWLSGRSASYGKASVQMATSESQRHLQHIPDQAADRFAQALRNHPSTGPLLAHFEGRLGTGDIRGIGGIDALNMANGGEFGAGGVWKSNPKSAAEVGRLLEEKPGLAYLLQASTQSGYGAARHESHAQTTEGALTAHLTKALSTSAYDQTSAESTRSWMWDVAVSGRMQHQTRTTLAAYAAVLANRNEPATDWVGDEPMDVPGVGKVVQADKLAAAIRFIREVSDVDIKREHEAIQHLPVRTLEAMGQTALQMEAAHGPSPLTKARKGIADHAVAPTIAGVEANRPDLQEQTRIQFSAWATGTDSVARNDHARGLLVGAARLPDLPRVVSDVLAALPNQDTPQPDCKQALARILTEKRPVPLETGSDSLFLPERAQKAQTATRTAQPLYQRD
jgi:hypothetical protein